MSTGDLLQWIMTAFTGMGLLYLAFRKAQPERESYSASAAAQYAQAAKLKGEENTKLENEIRALEARLQIIERKKYRVVMEFTVGDPPEVGKVMIEPIVDLPVDVINKNMKLIQGRKKP